jgi:heme-degrading monooxygenase HmoA
MYARTTTMRVPQHVDDLIALAQDEVMPLLSQQEGCVGLSLLIDRDTGRCITTSAWESKEAMRAGGEAVRESSDRAAQRFDTTPEVQEWEIAVLHRAHRIGNGACARVAWTLGTSSVSSTPIGTASCRGGRRRPDSAATAS